MSHPPHTTLSLVSIDQQFGKQSVDVSGARPNVEVVSGLQHSSAYVFRLTCVNSNGQYVGPGPEEVFKTEGMLGSRL